MSKDLTQRLNGSLEDKVDWLIAAVQRMDERLQNVETDVHDVKTRLSSLEAKVDARLKETRPIWEAVQAQLNRLQAQLNELKESQDRGFHRLDGVMDIISGNVNRLNAEQVDLDVRVGKIEKRLTQ